MDGANSGRSIAESYDRSATESGWLGPEIAFGLAYRYIRAGQTVLDIGIGTGLGSILFHKAGLKVIGMDISDEMLAACSSKEFVTALDKHDLTTSPYPYADASIDHVVCVGVLDFLENLDQAFSEVGRILREEGVFVFVVGYRKSDEKSEMILGPEVTGTDTTAIMYRYTTRQISSWLSAKSLALLQDQEFVVYMDCEKKNSYSAKVYLAQKKAGI